MRVLSPLNCLMTIDETHIAGINCLSADRRSVLLSLRSSVMHSIMFSEVSFHDLAVPMTAAAAAVR